MSTLPPPPAGFAPATPTGEIGKVRGLGVTILLAIVTFGIYTFVWYFKTSKEMKAHSGFGLGGPIALLIAIFAGIASPFISGHEVGQLYVRRGQQAPVSALTAFWMLLPLLGALIWYVKVNGSLNKYWESLGA